MSKELKERITALERELDSLKPGTIKTMKMCECGRHYHLPSDKCCDKCLIAELEDQLLMQSKMHKDDMIATRKPADRMIARRDRWIAELKSKNKELKVFADIDGMATLIKDLQAQLAEHEDEEKA